jgi:hypothetical protein
MDTTTASHHRTCHSAGWRRRLVPPGPLVLSKRSQPSPGWGRFFVQQTNESSPARWQLKEAAN